MDDSTYTPRVVLTGSYGGSNQPPRLHTALSQSSRVRLLVHGGLNDGTAAATTSADGQASLLTTPPIAAAGGGGGGETGVNRPKTQQQQQQQQQQKKPLLAPLGANPGSSTARQLRSSSSSSIFGNNNNGNNNSIPVPPPPPPAAAAAAAGRKSSTHLYQSESLGVGLAPRPQSVNKNSSSNNDGGSSSSNHPPPDGKPPKMPADAKVVLQKQKQQQAQLEQALKSKEKADRAQQLRELSKSKHGPPLPLPAGPDGAMNPFLADRIQRWIEDAPSVFSMPKATSRYVPPSSRGETARSHSSVDRLRPPSTLSAALLAARMQRDWGL